MNVFKKICIALIVSVVLISIGGFFILPSVLKPFFIKKISESLHRDVTIEDVRINPFALSATISGFKISDYGQSTPFVAFDKILVNADAVTSIYRRAIVLEEIRVDNPYIGITRNSDGSYNFSDLIPKEEAKTETPAKPFLFSLNNIQINGGKIDFRDLPNKTDHTVRELNLAIPFISNIEHYLKNYVEPKFSAVINNNLVALSGKTQLFLSSRSTSFDIELQDIDVPYYLQYVPAGINFKLPSARLDTKININFVINQDASPTMQITGNAALRKLHIDDLQGNNILRLPALTIDLASVEPFVSKVHLAQVAFEKPQIVIRRDKHGNINLLNLVRMDEKTKTRDVKQRDKVNEEKKKDLSLLIDKFLIDKAHITCLDFKQPDPVDIRINPLSLQTSKLSLKKEELAAVELALTVDRTGQVTAKGFIGLEPLSADLTLGVKNLPIRTFQPYFAELFQIDITRGSISTAGKFSFNLDTEANPNIKYRGNLSVNHFASIDRVHANDFLRFKKLAFHSLDVGNAPIHANIGEISLNDFFAKIVIHEGGSINIQDIVAAPKTETQEKSLPPDIQSAPVDQSDKSNQASPDIKIGKVSFSEGIVDFADFNIKPNYMVTMLNLKGSVTGLSSQEISRASVDLKGNLGYGSPIEITGSVNPLIKDLFADIKISFKDIEMSTKSPYTIRYLGYPVTKGKLHFDVSYLIEKRKLTAENKVFFDQLTFGDKVESPDAIKVPVTLAVSLLTDRRGQINLDIPLSGSLDDPKFRVWPIVWQIIVNLITKAVMSPFSLLGSLTGAGEELSFIEFDYGGAQVTEAEIKKLSVLAKALYERPNLKLEIESYVDREKDKDALKNIELSRLLKVQKLKDMVDKGRSPVPMEEISITQAEYEKYLALAYKAAKFPKPRTGLGLQKALPPLEMEKLMIENIAVTDGDLEQLASRRAQLVREKLLQKGVEAARIFLVKTQSLTPEKKDKVKDSRVYFKLR